MKNLPQNSESQNSKPPVTRWELIDAIAKLHVIQDDCSQLRTLLNNPQKPCCTKMRIEE
ncbi:hypothetical protein [Chroococcidiopsis sp. SAG 2025]|uniref:hypothetical protein n=1 Tax=Chroococcidiopsis sp. SAG 2025 TaxID=171389 RepID=UPI002936E4D6|nr:hypothetical protein [Chroococcidiopsis sp. SAG 2025]